MAMKRKRKYEKPAMQVYCLPEHRTMILAGSGVGATNSINGWGDGGTTDDDIYM